MRFLSRSLSSLLLASTLSACGLPDAPDAPDPAAPATVEPRLVPPSGTQPGAPYRWEARRWRSPLGLTIVNYGFAIDGLPIDNLSQVEIHNDAGELVQVAGAGAATLAGLRAAAPGVGHPKAGLAAARPGQPLAHRTERAVWHYAHGAIIPAVITDELDLLGAQPVSAITVADATTGEVLARRSALHELGTADSPDYLVYARPDGRPWTSPLGSTLPHPTGVPDGSVPPPVAQAALNQRTVRAALADPWLPSGATETQGNNVVAFFDSLIDPSGIFVDSFDDEGNPTPEYGPAPDLANHDFFAHPTDHAFAFPYDPAQSANEYYQDGFPGDPLAFPDPSDPALNAKIVETFYAANWLHDFFYGAGFDEVAGNAQRDNFGRGGLADDALIVHAGFNGTFTTATADGTAPVLDLGLNARSASRKDQGIDFSTMAHEWGHYLIGRLGGTIGIGDGLDNLQGLALHEGIADFVSVLVNYNDGDDPRGAFAVGSYGNLDYIERRPTLPPTEAPADAMYFGIRRYPYSLDFAKNPLTLRHLAVAPPADQPYYNWKGRGPLISESHTAGEVFSEALFACFGHIVLAHPHARPERNRERMAAYLVAGLAAFRFHPSYLDARNAILSVIRLASPFDDYPACKAGFASRGMGAGALGPDREFGSDDPFAFPPPPFDPASIEESTSTADRALRLVSSTFGAGVFSIDVRNTGLVDLVATALAITPATPAAVQFPRGRLTVRGRVAPEDVDAAAIPAIVDPCRLPADPAHPGARSLDYTVDATSLALPVLHARQAFHVSIPASCP